VAEQVQDVGVRVVEAAAPPRRRLRVVRRVHGRYEQEYQHPRDPVGGAEAAACVVRVCEVHLGVDEALHGDDRLQRSGTPAGSLHGGETSVGVAPHPDVAVAPRLLSAPQDGVHRVLCVFGCERLAGVAVRAAGAQEVQGQAGVAPSREVPVQQVGTAEVLAVRKGEHDQGDWPAPTGR
jgi:hypothetical protein